MEFVEQNVDDWTMFNDNQSAIKIAHSGMCCSRTKHIKVIFTFESFWRMKNLP